MDVFTIGLTQLPNHTDTSVNADRALSAIASWGARGADLVVFPECALTGFSARHGEADPDTIGRHLDRIELAAIAHDLVVLIPTIVKVDSVVSNTGWWLGAGIERARFDKIGLTESERLYFTEPGSPGARMLEIGGVRLGVLICREVDDDPTTYLGGEIPDVVLWPGYWGWDADDAWEEGLGAHAVARALGRPILQATFSRNENTTHEGAGPNGRSVVVGRDNEVVCWGPMKEDAEIEVVLTRDKEPDGAWEVSRAETVHLGARDTSPLT